MQRLRTPRFWAGCLTGWVLLTLIETTTLHFDAVRAGRASAPAVLLLDRAVSDVVWPIIAAIVFAWIDRATRRAAPGGIAAGSFALRAARLGLALAPLYVPWGCAARTVVHGGDLAYFANEMRRIASTTYLWDAFLFAMIALTACVVVVSQRSRHHERDSAELKARLAHAELDLLRAQLEPHFLFNALNTIAGLIRTAHPELATDALAKLSELLRYVVEASRQDRVPLAWELEFATNYLELQQLRFGPRMQFAIHLDAGRACDVPPLLLQPLIENAVVHGVAPTSDPVTIVVHILEANGELRVEIGNTRDDHASTGRASTGVGLRNTRQRLERMYGEDFVLDAGPDGPDHYRVTIALPQAAGYA